MITKKHIEFYSKLDGHLFPLDGKIPLSKGWRKRRYTKKQLMKFVSKGYNLGWAIGTDYIVIDVDPRNKGFISLKKLRKKYDLPDLSNLYPTIITGGGGFHYYCKLPNTVKSSDLHAKTKRYKGIDIKKSGGYVVIVGSTHPDTGEDYKYDTSSPIKRVVKKLEKSLVKAFKKKLRAAIEGEAKTISTKTLKRLLSKLPVSDYNTNDKWFPILAASHSATKGKGLSTFLKWSLSDSNYSNDEELISSRWNSFSGKGNQITIQTLLAEVLKYDSLHQISSDREVKKEFNDEVSESGKNFVEKKYPAIPEQLIGDLPFVIAKNVINKKFNEGKHIINGSDLRYWGYNGHYWEPIQINIVERYLYEETLEKKLRNTKIKKPINTIFKSSETVLRAMTASDLDLFGLFSNKSIINTKNYELWIDDKTGKIKKKKHNPKSCLTYCLDTEYDSEADCPRFKKALLEIFNKHKDKKEIISHLMEVIGYTIQAKKNIASWVLFHGKGSNGKTVLIQVISALLGDSVLEKSVDELHTNKNNHALASLPGKLAVIDDDVSANATLPDGMIKKISENKFMTANPKGASEFRFRNAAIPLLAANNWPSTKDLSEGLRRRALIFPFTRSFSKSESDITLADYIIDNELAGVLNLALEGLKRVRERGYFNPPESCKNAKDRWFLSNSQIHQFIEECFKKSANKKVNFSKVWTLYNTWCLDNGIRMSMTKQRLKTVLADIGIKVEYTKSRRLQMQGFVIQERN